MKKAKSLIIILATTILAAGAFSLRDRLTGSVRQMRGGETVGTRLEQYGELVRQRLLPSFEAAKVQYPPERIALVGLKQEKVLEVWGGGANGPLQAVRTYAILGASGRLGPKLREGDGQIPEGLYRIESLNPNSRFHLALRLSYPNAFDKAQAKLDGRNNLGGDIMIHGSNVSIGCLAMGDRAAEELFVVAAETGLENISVILSPVDFRRREMPEITYALPAWTKALYRQIALELAELTSDGTASLSGPAPLVGHPGGRQ
ncbi:MAG: hypothetical protein JSU94_17820 [Phycisphaerales bacterium]|nr:MAG: hypothetical protein JSU94_17820 [Phycisphaerales bacterium]